MPGRRILSYREVRAHAARVAAGLVPAAEIARLVERLAERAQARGPDKLGRRLRRKARLGMAGAF